MTAELSPMRREVNALSFWPRVLDAAPRDAREIVESIVEDAEKRRRKATYDTGSILAHEALLLLALAQYLSARIVIEIGTFIGTSTVALASASTVASVFTCDASNDCLPSHGAIRTYPKKTSTEMLTELVKRRVIADLCFIDGVLGTADLRLLLDSTHPNTVYAFHDYNYGPKLRKRGKIELNIPRKGIGNVRALTPHLPSHVLLRPEPDTTLALLMPESLL